jgi:ABC-type lipoprotein release transport system permease subunit
VVDEDYASRITDAIDVEVTALWTFSAAAALAGLIIIGQALVRHASRTNAEQRALAAMGLARRDRALASALAVAPAIVGGLLGAVLVSVALSPLFPRGLARLAEVDPGIHVDGQMLLIGGVVLGTALVAAAFAAGLIAGREERDGAPRPSRVERLLEALPAVPALGARLTLARNRRGAAPAWAGAAAVAVGVAGVLAVTTVDRSVQHLLAAPALYGAPWQIEGPLDTGERAASEALAVDPDVEMVAEQLVPAGETGMQATGPGGSASVEPFTFDVARGAVPLVIEDGRAPGPGEVAVGAEILERLGAGLGDAIEIDGFADPVAVTIVGRTVNAGNDELDQGFYVPPETFDALLRDCPPGEDDPYCVAVAHGVGVQVRDGADVEATLARLRTIEPRLRLTERPSVVDSLNEIGSTPAWLGAFLVGLGLAGFAHALLTGSRRSHRDLAVARALGLRPREAAEAVRWAAALITLAGAGVGILLGLLAGRLVWQRLVDGVGALLETELSVAAVILAPVCAVAAALLVAIVPSRRAATLSPGAVLRAE